MIDFAITPSGDLIFGEFEEPKGFKLDFRVAESKGLNIKFHMLEQKAPPKEGPFKVSFTTKQRTGVTHKATLVSKTEQKIQRIRIALSTERGELPSREYVGSRISLVRHGILHEPTNLRKIEEFVLEAIAGVLVSPEVIAKPVRGIGNFYCQTVGIYIYERNILVFKFQI
jgi:hypothetical protein